jgi:phthalate 4,5-dioxygenase reductase subunit
MTTADQPHPAELPVRITRKDEIAQSIFALELTSPAGTPLPSFSAGAHIGVHVPIGVMRKYSLISPAQQREHYAIAVKREENGAGGSKSLIDHTQIGDELIITAPKNDFELIDAPSTLLIAGGIGITPLYAMFHAIKQKASGRVQLIYLTRDRASTAFYDELSAASLKAEVKIHHDNADPNKNFDLWPLLEKPMGRHLYCCGPRGLMDNVRDMSGHWPATHVHFEDFGSTPQAHRRDDRPFTLRLRRSQLSLDVPADRSILDTLRAHGIYAPSSCESGSCGSCKTPLLRGQADHRDLVLAPHEQNDYIMICVSRALGDELELDL